MRSDRVDAGHDLGTQTVCPVDAIEQIGRRAEGLNPLHEACVILALGELPGRGLGVLGIATRTERAARKRSGRETELRLEVVEHLERRLVEDAAHVPDDGVDCAAHDVACGSWAAFHSAACRSSISRIPTSTPGSGMSTKIAPSIWSTAYVI